MPKPLALILAVVLGPSFDALAQPADSASVSEAPSADLAPPLPAQDSLAAVSEEPARPRAGGEDEGVPVPSADVEEVMLRPPEMAPLTALARTPGDEPEAETEAEAVAELPEDASPCEWAEWMRRFPEDAPLLEMRGGPFSIAPRGLIQLAGVPWQGDEARIATGSPADEPGFRFRRLRLGVEGKLPIRIEYEITGEFADPAGQYGDGAARLLDANLALRLDYLWVVAGASKAPFSGSYLTPAAFQTFLDRPWGVDGASADARYGIAPGRMLGVQIGGAVSVMRFYGGVYNGNEDYFLGNNNSGMLYAFRAECYPLGDLPDGQMIAAGGDPRVRIGAAYYFNDDAAGDWHAAEGDVRFRWRGLTIEGEFLWSRFLPDEAPEMPPGEVAQTDRMGYYAQAGYMILDDLLEIAARYEGFLLDDGVNDFNDRWGVAGAATLFLLRNRVKVQLEYAHRQEAQGPQVPNDHVALQLQGRF